MSNESTALIVRQFLEGELPTGSFLSSVLADLKPEDMAKLRAKAAEGQLAIELEKMAMVNRFRASSVEIKEFIDNVKALEISSGNPFERSRYEATGEFATASGKTTIEVKKGCYIATAVYVDETHPNLETLRLFRDEYLESTQAGKALCDAYYRLSPAVAKSKLFTPLHLPVRTILNLICKLIRSR
jgi:hypothetical protein